MRTTIEGRPIEAARPHTLTILTGVYAMLSVLTLVAIALLRDHADLVTGTVWVRGTILAVTSVILLAISRRATRGNRRALLRLRIISAVLIVTIIAFVAVPGSVPLWMKFEQAGCGVLLIAVSVAAQRVAR